MTSETLAQRLAETLGPSTGADAGTLEGSVRAVLAAWRTHGEGTPGPLVHAFWAEWHDAVGGGAEDPSAFRDGVRDLEQMIGNTLANQLPAGWNPESVAFDNDENA